MAHNIYQQKFASMHKPAWHGLGMVLQNETAATDAARLLGLPIITTQGVRTDDGLPAHGYKAILGEDKGQRTVYSIVSTDYHEITHGDFVDAWDRATHKAPVETIGLLGKGETLFVTTKLPSFDIKGDECENYLLAYNPLSGREAVTGRITPVRVVCQNTLTYSGNRYTEQYRVIHTSASAEQIEKWLREVWARTQAKTDALRHAYEILASYRMQDSQVRTLAETIYADTKRPDADERTNEGLDKLASWEKENKGQKEHRENVYNLYAGQAVGSSTRAASGTAWGAYNAVVEYEDYKKKFRKVASAVFGAGADRKTAAFDTLIEMVKGE